LPVRLNDEERAMIAGEMGEPRRWAVEHQGTYSDHTLDREEAKAAANKRARALQDAGRPCQVRVTGEHGFFADA